jgi:hypothetical protein
MERWASIPGATQYEVSSLGRVWSHKSGRLLATTPAKSNGYSTVNINNVPRLVHRLMWGAFNGPLPSHVLVRHKNDVRTDNRLSNLAVGSHLDNRVDSHHNGNGRLRVDPALVPAIIEELRTSSTRKLAAKYGVSHTTIRQLCKRKSYFLLSSSAR